MVFLYYFHVGILLFFTHHIPIVSLLLDSFDSPSHLLALWFFYDFTYSILSCPVLLIYYSQIIQ